VSHRFQKHYSIEEARALLPLVRCWLERLQELRDQVVECERRLDGLMTPGADFGGPLVNQMVRALAVSREVLYEFYSRELQLKDIDRGLVDFPAIIAGSEVFLCWEKDEPDIEHWHDLDAGFAGREPL